MSAAELLLTGGRFVTLDADSTITTAMAVGDGRILALGDEAALAGLVGPGTRRVDLGGHTVLPGFVDAHVHVWKVGQLLEGVLDVRGADGIADLQERLRDFARRHPEQPWILARGYNDARLREARHPTRHDLDAAVADRPVLLGRTCGHISVANSEALRRAGVDADVRPPPGGDLDRAEDGAPTGVLRETAQGLVQRAVPQPSEEEVGAMIRAAGRRLLGVGVVAACDPGVVPAFLEAYRALERRGELPIRMQVMALRRADGEDSTLPLPRRTESPTLGIDTIKLFADGGLSGATAALQGEYADGGSGVLRLDRDEIVELALEAQRAGLRVAVHAIGDRAIEEAVAALERLAAEGPGRRHRIEHLGLPSAAHLRRLARLRAFAVTQPIFLAELGANFRAALPAALRDRCYPFRAMLEAGVEVAFSSDAPVVEELAPLAGVQAAVLRGRPADEVAERLAPAEAVSVEQALRAYTVGAAAACGLETELGSLAAGKRADFVVLDEDPLGTPAERLHEVGVVSTWIDGEPRYET